MLEAVSSMRLLRSIRASMRVRNFSSSLGVWVLVARISSRIWPRRFSTSSRGRGYDWLIERPEGDRW